MLFVLSEGKKFQEDERPNLKHKSAKDMISYELTRALRIKPELNDDIVKILKTIGKAQHISEIEAEMQTIEMKYQQLCKETM